MYVFKKDFVNVLFIHYKTVTESESQKNRWKILCPSAGCFRWCHNHMTVMCQKIRPIILCTVWEGVLIICLSIPYLCQVRKMWPSGMWPWVHLKLCTKINVVRRSDIPVQVLRNDLNRHIVLIKNSSLYKIHLPASVHKYFCNGSNTNHVFLKSVLLHAVENS